MTRTALVLGGGGVLGAFQAGLLKPLFRSGFRPSMIVGTSAGALNGAFMAFRPDASGADELARIWRSLRDRQLFFFSPLRAAFQLVSGGLCLARNDLLRTLVERNVPSDDFAATAVPLYITTTNLTKAGKDVFHSGHCRARCSRRRPCPASSARRDPRPAPSARVARSRVVLASSWVSGFGDGDAATAGS